MCFPYHLSNAAGWQKYNVDISEEKNKQKEFKNFEVMTSAMLFSVESSRSGEKEGRREAEGGGNLQGQLWFTFQGEVPAAAAA